MSYFRQDSSPTSNSGTNATNPTEKTTNITDSSITITTEERTMIETAARIQLQETGGVNRSKLLRDIGWQNRNKGYTK